MKTKTKVTTLLILSAMATPFVSCGRSEKAPEEDSGTRKARRHGRTLWDKSPATAPVDTIPGQTRLKVTCRCLATSQPEMLDLMPRDVRSARRDTALLGSINRGEVFVVQPGESGYILQKSDNKLLLRFPDKIAWVMASDTK